jgi:DNA-binding transcriptional MerR regulator
MKGSSVEFFSTADVARRLGITPNGVRTARSRGDLRPASITAGGIALYDDAEISRFAAARGTRRRLLERDRER